MRFTSLQWNIGGGLARSPDADPLDPLSYRQEYFDALVAYLKGLSPDIITLQESHSDDNRNQVLEIAKALNLPFAIDDVYEDSHTVKGQKLGQGIVSRFPLSGHKFEYFYNPKARGKSPTGENWISHDKGVTSCLADIDGITVNLKTSHSFPYRRFKVDPLSKSTLPLRTDMAEKLKPESEKYLYQGDINYDEYSAKNLFPDLFVGGVEEVVLDAPTTPKGRKYDHIIFRNLKHTRSEVLTGVLSDHFPVLSEFEL